MLNLLLKYDLGGLPDDERIQKKYDDCRKDLDTLRKYKKIYLEHMDEIIVTMRLFWFGVGWIALIMI